MFKRLRPHGHDVFELKAPDVRIFGWFHERDRFIAARGASMEDVKNHDLYLGFVGEVDRARAALDLDEPKCLWGAGEDDVVSV